MIRITVFPTGVTPPKKVRIYRRRNHYVLQWWDPGAGRTLSERVEGDLIDAIGRARAIDTRLEEQRSAGTGSRRLGPGELIDAFIQDLHRRADAGTVAPGTVARYASALGHYRDFMELPEVSRQYRLAISADRGLAQRFVASLNAKLIAPNGHPNTAKRRMSTTNAEYAVDVVRAMYEWAADPHRGGLLPDGFRSPFSRRSLERRAVVRDVFGEPDITLAMATDFLGACDSHQLTLFAPMLFYGLRPGELVHVCHEHAGGAWLRVGCIDALDFRTKGRRDKRLPLIEPLRTLLGLGDAGDTGLVWRRRGVGDDCKRPPLLGASLDEMTAEYQRRCAASRTTSARGRQSVRADVIHDAGGVDYDLLQGEFTRLARALGWPRSATLKDLRHLCNVCLENGGMPEHDRQYLLGQSQGKAAIASYTHLNRLRENYERAVVQELAPLRAIIQDRLPELRVNSPIPES